jgi:hypothetical protein
METLMIRVSVKSQRLFLQTMENIMIALLLVFRVAFYLKSNFGYPIMRF